MHTERVFDNLPAALMPRNIARVRVRLSRARGLARRCKRVRAAVAPSKVTGDHTHGRSVGASQRWFTTIVGNVLYLFRMIVSPSVNNDAERKRRLLFSSRLSRATAYTTRIVCACAIDKRVITKRFVRRRNSKRTKIPG